MILFLPVLDHQFSRLPDAGTGDLVDINTWLPDVSENDVLSLGKSQVIEVDTGSGNGIDCERSR